MADIHPSAIVEPGARLGEGVVVGPFSIVGGEVELGDHVNLVSHAVVTGHTRIGAHTRIYPFASIGHIPQDQKYKGESSELVVGEHCMIREYVTMNPGTKGGGRVTRVGNHCLLMVGAHVAHDCKVGDHVVMANNATLAGHVVLEDYVILGGLSAVHQFVRIGCHAMVGGMTGVENDVIPYGSVKGDRGRLSGLNIVGLRRRRFSREDIHALRNAYRLLFAEEGTMAERIKDVSELFSENVAVMDIVEFIRTDSSRTICQPKMEHAA